MLMFGIRAIILFLLLLSSCAQVGTISGGPKDKTPPGIVSCSPFDGQKNVSTNQMVIEFNEYINLKNPNENIILLPANVDYDYSLKGKTLQIDFQQELKRNTTYSLYLNGAVKDITEGNNSLIQIAFSTGNEIDENEAYFKVFDGFSGKIQKEVMIALYDSLSQINPTYFSKTDEDGYSKLRALKEGSFYYSAYTDENKNRIRDKDEMQYANSVPIRIDSLYKDTLTLYISKPKNSPLGLEAVFITPYILEVSKPESRSFDELSFEDSSINRLNSIRVDKDSRRYVLPRYFESVEMILDTLNKKVRNDGDIKELTLIEPMNKLDLLPSMCCLNLDFSAPIDSFSLEAGSFSLFNIEDSSVIELRENQLSYQLNQFRFGAKGSGFNRALFKIDSASIFATNGATNSEMEFLIERKRDEDLGALVVKVDTDMDWWFVELIKNDKVISIQTSFIQSETVYFEHLPPGSYSLNIVGDKNKNDRWDPFNPDDYTGPEKRFVYERPVKIKANWEHEIDFIINE